MPSRNGINKYELLVNDIRRVAKKREIEPHDITLKRIAMLIAAVSSGHSWKTFKYLTGETTFDKYYVSKETEQAFEHGWKNVRESDVEEVANLLLDEHLFNMWLFYVVKKEDRGEYRNLFSLIKREFADGIDPIEQSIR